LYMRTHYLIIHYELESEWYDMHKHRNKLREREREREIGIRIYDNEFFYLSSRFETLSI
jgi:hypothetical protein